MQSQSASISDQHFCFATHHHQTVWSFVWSFCLAVCLTPQTKVLGVSDRDTVEKQSDSFRQKFRQYNLLILNIFFYTCLKVSDLLSGFFTV